MRHMREAGMPQRSPAQPQKRGGEGVRPPCPPSAPPSTLFFFASSWSGRREGRRRDKPSQARPPRALGGGTRKGSQPWPQAPQIQNAGSGPGRRCDEKKVWDFGKLNLSALRFLHLQMNYNSVCLEDLRKQRGTPPCKSVFIKHWKDRTWHWAHTT